MATGLLALFDDIATLLDDVSVMAKVAAKKTSGVIGDDLVLNAEQLNGVASDRELRIVWSVFLGGLLNKLILVPLALALSYFTPFLITPLLLFGGLYLCFEGVEKVLEKFGFHKKEETKNISDGDKIKGAVRTDLILSTEIIIIALGSMSKASIAVQAISLVLIAIVMNIGIYGLVALIVKIDDLGLMLLKTQKVIIKHVGQFLIWLSPRFMKLLGVLGTTAMFLVGGGIVIHSAPAIHHWVESIQNASQLPWLVQLGFELSSGITSGLVVVLLITLLKKVKTRFN
jgi:predicted DNA repair protein MutK